MPSEPLILGFDTSAAHCAAALLSGDRIIAERHEEMKKGQAERLMPMVQEILTEAGIAPGDLTAIGVGIGPGNFTGVRISVSAARGMALALKTPAIGVSLLEATAFGHDNSVLSCLAAPRDSAYLQLFGHGESEPQHAPLDEIPGDAAPAGATCVGPAAESVAARLSLLWKPSLHAPACAIARIAATRLDRKHLPPAPLYMRPADAAPSRDVPPALIDE